MLKESRLIIVIDRDFPVRSKPELNDVIATRSFHSLSLVPVSVIRP